MSRLIRAALLTLTAAVVSPWMLSAQQQTEAELLREIERLIPLVQEAGAEAEAALVARNVRDRAAAEAAAVVDTFSVGGMTIIAPLADRERAERLFADVWPQFAVLASERLARMTFTYQDGREEVPIFVDCCSFRHVEVPWWNTDDEARQRVYDQVAVALHAELSGMDHPIYLWAPVNPVGEIPWETIYYSVAMSAAQVSRDCLDGDIDRCVDALILSGHEDGHAERWYTPEERAYHAVRIRHATSNADGDWELCSGGVSQEACDAIMERLSAHDPRLIAPFAGFVHASLVTLALERGGDGAWQRLVDNLEEEPRVVLEAVSGVTTEELVGEWYDELTANRPEVHAGAFSRTAMALIWFVFFATLALRSTRWRLG